ncbi:transglycosylase domain-containing protein [Cellulomonas iranensis]|uniref:transglycosylase domain-containing protein n=1 Tax=Cellulomonas iranensis TaxID=76862 RepID=UPI0021F3ED4E|nr:transglycosylase domain-containing protein [Cellulomonas iranensis]
MPNPARSRGRQVNAVQALALLLSFVLVAGIGGLLTAGLVLPGVAAANGVATMSATAFDEVPSELEQRTLPQKSEILAADGTLLATFFYQNRVVVPLSEIAPIMQKAVVAVEDRRFYEHAGVDPQGMLRAAIATLAGGDGGGASTLTQQYVKNVFVDAALRAETKEERDRLTREAQESEGLPGIARKLREAKIAITLEKNMSKDEILEKYLNIAAFGSSVYGVESAAQYYFGIPASQLNYLQSATIAGITQSPAKWDPVGAASQTEEEHQARYKTSQTRRDRVLRDMHREGFITQEELDTGLATPVQDTLNVQPLRQGCMTAGDAVPGSGFFCDYVTKVIGNDPVFGETAAERTSRLYRGGLTITTTLVPGEQAVADAEVKNGVPVDDPSGVASAIVSVEPRTGKITAMAQNRTYSALQNQGERETSVNYNTSYRYGGSGGFAPGSTFKVFTLLEWLKQGHALQETVNGTRLKYNNSEFTASCVGRLTGEYPFRNSEGGRAINQTVIDATKNSVNSAYIAMAQQLDLCNIMQGAADLGVTRAGNPNANDGDGRPMGDVPFSPYPSSVLGTNSTSPLQMAAAYATFAADGTYCKPIAITSIVDSTGAELPVPSADCRDGAIDPKYASAINFALSNVWTGTGKDIAKPPFPAAGKTGTTSSNEYNWFVGYTPLRATAVWVGFPGEMRSMNRQTINGRTYYRGPYGSSIAGPTWSRFMTQVLAGAENPGFSNAGDREVFGERVAVPSVVGRSESDARGALERAGFRVSVSGEQVQSPYPAGTVAQQSASSATRGATITLTLSNGQPPAPDPAAPGGDAGGPGGGGPGGGGPGGGGRGQGGNNGQGNPGNQNP